MHPNFNLCWTFTLVYSKLCISYLHFIFILFSDRFLGRTDVTNVTSSGAVLTWLPGPGDISHYRLEVEGNNETLMENLANLTYHLTNLTAGTHYFVKVFPVKCERDLNPQEVAFYTGEFAENNTVI